jgi:hypothetical protein
MIPCIPPTQATHIKTVWTTDTAEFKTGRQRKPKTHTGPISVTRIPMEEVATIAVEAETAPVKVAVEAEPSSGARGHSAKEAHSLQAPPRPKPEQSVSVSAPDDAGTPAPTRRSGQEALRPCVAQPEAPGPNVARQEISWPHLAQQWVSGPRVAQQRVSGAPTTREEAPRPHVVLQRGPKTVVHQGNLRERE